MLKRRGYELLFNSGGTKKNTVWKHESHLCASLHPCFLHKHFIAFLLFVFKTANLPTNLPFVLRTMMTQTASVQNQNHKREKSTESASSGEFEEWINISSAADLTAKLKLLRKRASARTECLAETICCLLHPSKPYLWKPTLIKHF